MATLVSKVDAAHTLSSARESQVMPEMPVPLPSSGSKSTAFSLSASTACHASGSRSAKNGTGQARAKTTGDDSREMQPARHQASSIVATTISLIGRGLTKSRNAGPKTIVDGNDISEDVISAINASLARHRDRGLSPLDAFMSVEPEAKKMLASTAAAEKRDDESRAHNAQVRKREAIFSITGVCCLVFPILLIFDALTVTLPEDFRSVLAMGAQEDSIFGRTALYV